MNFWSRHTLRRSVELTGVGIHSGEVSSVRLGPADFGAGWLMRPIGASTEPLRVGLGCAEAIPGSSRLVGPYWRLGTVEHAFAALMGMGVTDVLIEFSGAELPILDGSAIPWCDAIRSVGLVGGGPLEPLRVQQTVRVERGTAWASLEPSEGCEVCVDVDFSAASWVNAEATIDLACGDFVAEVGWARTFVLLEQARALREAGRGRGASLENTVLVGPESALNPMRREDEVVRHKLLDAIGDLGLLGTKLRGRMTVHQGSHALHLLLLRTAAKQHGWGL